MAVTIPDEADAWSDRFKRQLNRRTAFAEAAAGFDATFRFEILPDDTYPGDPIAFSVVVEDGTCPTATAGRDRDYDFALRGPYEAWRSLLEGRVDVSAAVLDGPFDLEGSTIALMQHRKTISELVAAAQAVDTEYAY